MTKAFYAIALAILSVTLFLLWCTSPAQAEPETNEPPPLPVRSVWLPAMPLPAPACMPSGWTKRRFSV